MATEPQVRKKITDRDFLGAFLRIWALQTAENFERMQALGYVYTIGPILKKLHGEGDRFVDSLKRHLEFFNTQPYLAAPIMGVTIALEEQMANDEPVSADAVNSIKAGLMGPFAGIGDSVFWFTLNPIFIALGASMAMKGNLLGPVVYFVLANSVAAAMYWYGIRLGYKSGVNFITQAKGSLERLTTAMSIMGLTMVGCMTAAFITVETPLHIKVGGADLALQKILDQLCPNLLPLGCTFLAYWLLVRKRVKTHYMIFGIIAFGIVSSYLGIFK